MGGRCCQCVILGGPGVQVGIPLEPAPEQAQGIPLQAATNDLASWCGVSSPTLRNVSAQPSVKKCSLVPNLCQAQLGPRRYRNELTQSFPLGTHGQQGQESPWSMGDRSGTRVEADTSFPSENPLQLGAGNTPGSGGSNWKMASWWTPGEARF